GLEGAPLGADVAQRVRAVEAVRVRVDAVLAQVGDAAQATRLLGGQPATGQLVGRVLVGLAHSPLTVAPPPTVRPKRCLAATAVRPRAVAGPSPVARARGLTPVRRLPTGG